MEGAQGKAARLQPKEGQRVTPQTKNPEEKSGCLISLVLFGIITAGVVLVLFAAVRFAKWTWGLW